jgi:iron complex transport system ATP-binding protein
VPDQPPLIQYKNVSVRRNGHTVLDCVNLAIAADENVAILGPNGAGKTSLIKSINREIYPVLDGANSYLRILGAENWNVFELRSRLGIVADDLIKNHLINLTCRELVLSGFFNSFVLWKREVTPEMQQKAQEVMDFLKVSHLAETGIGEISTGEARRVLISRALVPDPSTLLLDEPTSSLDPAASRSLLIILRELVSHGKNLIIITHNLTDIIPEVKRVILMNHGKICADGLKEKILTADCLSAFFGVRLDVAQRQGHYHWWYV